MEVADALYIPKPLTLIGGFALWYNYYMAKTTKTKIPAILQTSEGTGKISLTFTGLAALLIIYVLESSGITVDHGDVMNLVNDLATFTAMGVTVYGAARKVINAVK
jgi:hypothetical protein